MSDRICHCPILLFAWLILVAVADGAEEEKNGRAARFAHATASVVAILPADDVLPIIYATAVAPDGLVATKASGIEDHESLVAQLIATGDTARVTHRYIDRENDIAVLQTEFENLPAITWTTAPGDQPLPLGTLLMATDPPEKTPRLGVIAASQRPIEKRGAALGVRLDGRSKHVRIDGVFPDKAADKAGLLAGDFVLAVNEHTITSVEDLQEQIFSRDPGDSIDLHIERSGIRESIPVRLGYKSDIFDLFDRNQMLSGQTSRRRSGFSEVIQHDIPLPPTAMGTPLLDLEGHAVGLNIARVDRVTTYALPAAQVEKCVADLLARGLPEPDPEPEPHPVGD